MVTYRIECATATSPAADGHGHVQTVGLDNGARLSVNAVRSAMNNGNSFFTIGSRTGKLASVHQYRCPDCGFETIRSGPDAVTDNNLDYLPACPR